MTRGSQVKPHLLQKLESYYLTGSVTLQELSNLSGVGLSTLKRYASARNWFARKKSRRLLIEAEATNNLSQRLLTQVKGIQQTAPYCLPMSKERHFRILIELLKLDCKIKKPAPQEQQPAPFDNVVLMRRAAGVRLNHV